MLNIKWVSWNDKWVCWKIVGPQIAWEAWIRWFCNEFLFKKKPRWVWISRFLSFNYHRAQWIYSCWLLPYKEFNIMNSERLIKKTMFKQSGFVGYYYSFLNNRDKRKQGISLRRATKHYFIASINGDFATFVSQQCNTW